MEMQYIFVYIRRLAMKLSWIVPCYNEESNVGPFYEAAESVLETTDYDYELIFINDGSKDNTLNQLKSIYKEHPKNVAVVNFSRNFGKEAAILAGLRHSRGELVTIIDADLQQRPEIALEMVDFLVKNEQYDAVAAYQEQRIEGKGMSWTKNLFYKMINKVSDTYFYPSASDFRTLRKSVVDTLCSLPEYHRFSKGLFSWVGFETYYMPYRAHERNSGDSKWSFWKLFKYAVDGFISFTTFPLKIATYLGIFLSFCSMIYMMVVIIQKLFCGVDIEGYPTIVCLILLLGGIQLMILGIIGEYLSKIYIQGKNRPVYIEKTFWDTSVNDIEK